MSANALINANKWIPIADGPCYKCGENVDRPTDVTGREKNGEFLEAQAGGWGWTRQNGGISRSHTKCMSPKGLDQLRKRSAPEEISLSDQLKADGYTTSIRGKDYILLPGLLKMAFSHGLNSIAAEPLTIDVGGPYAVFKATASGARGTFTGHAIADPTNMRTEMIPSFVMVCETRAVARALRFYCGIGQTCLDELPPSARE